MMTTVGTFEAKPHLAQPIVAPSEGERVMITKRGKPIEMLVPAEAYSERDTARVGQDILEYRTR
jgi:prevent-host-death family protein